MSYFSDLYGLVNYPIASEHSRGLRNAQIGAIHAIASHSTLEPVDAAVIVMPTGSGKTTVLMLAPYVLQKTKVLIVTPSAMVRGQIVEEYKQLKTLKHIGVFHEDVKPPIVYEAEHLFNLGQIDNISCADVVVASHQVAASISESELKNLFDYVIIDEAHHVPAATWQKIINDMKHAASLLVTATPFRLDKKEIQGTHIYNYPLSKAYHDGIFGAISFIPIDETTGMMLSAGHAFCKVAQDGTDSTIGYSSGSKFWSSSYLPIPEYVLWCDSCGKKIVNRTITVKTNTNYDRLPIPTGISKYSDNILFCFFQENSFLSPPSLRIDGSNERLGLLTDADLKFVQTTPLGDAITFDYILGDFTERFVCNTLGEYFSSTNLFVCRDGAHAIKLSEYFTENPLLFKTADDTVYSGHEVLQGNVDFESFDQGRIITFDWDGSNTDISKEAENAANGKITIQTALKEYIMQNKEYSHIIFDHGTGEVADYITFTSDESFIKAELFHCKAMKGANYNSSVSDIYEVAQQAIKCTVWIKSKTALLTKIQARVKGSSTDKFIRGDLKTLKALLQSQKAMEVVIHIVQPAISKNSPMADPVGRILSAATFYIRHTGRAKALKIIGSH